MRALSSSVITLSDDEMYAAVLRGDPSYDGRFFTGVISTGIFCYPSCSCRKPRRENVRFLATREEALEAGFRPCKRCMPHLDRGRAGYEEELYARILTLIEQNLDTLNVDRISHALGLSRNYLQRIFRERKGLTLGRYISQERAVRAAQMLRDGSQSVIDASMAVGFGSLSAFYSNFERFIGVTPGTYRKDCEVLELRRELING